MKQGKRRNLYFMEVKDILKRFDLSRNYVTECLKHLAPFFAGHYSRGANNRLVFDSSALTLFEQIKTLKDLGKTLPQIKQVLETEIGKRGQREGNEPSTAPTTPDNRGGDPTSDKLLDALTESHKSALNAKEETIQAQKETIQSLKNELLSLPDGRTPEQIKDEWNRQRQRAQKRTDLLDKLATLQRRWIFDKPRRQKQIVQQLKDLDA